ncbi:MAG TPA: hypothetical protein VFS18_00205, partial [Actinomycetota bacterium]|nr:hypothetical protein [Actinomycetota bacterium]
TAERLFGDAFAPDLSELTVSGESLWASGSSPATGAFALAEAALQAALAQGTFATELGDGPLVTGEGADTQVDIPSANALSELLQGGSGAGTGVEANAAD